MWIKKTLGVKNTSSKDGIFVKIKPVEQEFDTSSCQLESQMILSVSNSSNKKVLWGGSLRDFYSTTNALPLSYISAKNTQEYIFIISFNQESPDDCQGSSTSFSLNVYLEAADTSQINTLCEDTAPQNAPKLVSVMQDTYGFTLNWQNAPDPVSYYSISYGTSSGNYTTTNPNAGGRNTSSYTLSGLDKNSRYYFVLQAGNGCAVSSYSNEISVNIPTLSPTANQPTQPTYTNTTTSNTVTDSIPSTVSSVESENRQPTPTGSVLGESITKTPQKKDNFLSSLLKKNEEYSSMKDKKIRSFFITIPLIFVFIAYLIFKKRKID